MSCLTELLFMFNLVFYLFHINHNSVMVFLHGCSSLQIQLSKYIHMREHLNDLFIITSDTHHLVYAKLKSSSSTASIDRCLEFDWWQDLSE